MPALDTARGDPKLRPRIFDHRNRMSQRLAAQRAIPAERKT
jgi:hypothetical protein